MRITLPKQFKNKTMEKSELMTILIQTGFNIERMFEDKAIKEPAYKVLKYRNDLAIAELEHMLENEC